MTLSIFILIMIAAIIHAGWNSLIKGSDDKFMSTATLSLMTAGIMLLLLPFVTFPNHAALPYFIMSVLLQIIYYILLAQTYKITDIGLSYPIMRGTAPLLVALLSRLIWGEIIPPLSWLGILLIVGEFCGLDIVVLKLQPLPASSCRLLMLVSSPSTPLMML